MTLLKGSPDVGDVHIPGVGRAAKKKRKRKKLLGENLEKRNIKRTPDYPHGSSIKWPKVYRGLRRRGMSKEKAARISNAMSNKYRGGSRQPLSRTAGKKPIPEDILDKRPDLRKHMGPGPHPSGSPQEVHGLRGGTGGEYEKNRVKGESSIDSLVGRYKTTVSTKAIAIKTGRRGPGAWKDVPAGQWKIERTDGVQDWTGDGGEVAMLAQLSQLDTEYVPPVPTEQDLRVQWIEERWMEDLNDPDHGYTEADFDDWLRDNFNDDWLKFNKADDPEQVAVDADNLYDRDGISHRTGGRWMHTQEQLQKHMGPGPHPSGSPQSVHGRSREGREPIVTFDPPAVVTEAVEGWFALNPELSPLNIDWANHRQDHDFQMQVAKEYDSLPLYDPAAKPSYDAFSSEIEAQFDYLTQEVGIRFEAVDYDPYRNLMEVAQDLVDNNQVLVMATAVTGGHPMISDEVNDKFRFVHDIFGHVATGRNFDRHGEEAAFLHHASMFSEAARPAMASETRGQNASLIANREFGPQRAALMEPWAYDLNATVKKHYGPGNHPSGSPQTVHGSGGTSTLPRVRTGIDDDPTIRGLAQMRHERAAAIEPEVTALMQEVSDATEGQLQGLEFRLKTEESMRRKIFKDAEETGMSHESAAYNIRDAVRYTMTWEPDENFTVKYEATLAVLEDNGWGLYDSKDKNFFAPGDHYGGINAQFTNGEDFFELQFHTPGSFAIKEKSWPLYNKLREAAKDERATLISEIDKLWNSDLSYIPPGIESIGTASSRILKSRWVASEFMKRLAYWTFNDGEKDLALFRLTDADTIERWDDGQWVESSYTLPEIRGLGGSSDFDQVSDKFAAEWIKGGSADFSAPVVVAKSDEFKNLVFGWASVAFNKDGTQILDRQGHAIDVEDLEDAAYDFTVHKYGTGDMHRSEGFGQLVESMVFTKEKAELMGLPANSAPQGWWVGFKVPPEYHEQVRKGERTMFSIEGTAKLEPFS